MCVGLKIGDRQIPWWIVIHPIKTPINIHKLGYTAIPPTISGQTTYHFVKICSIKYDIYIFIHIYYLHAYRTHTLYILYTLIYRLWLPIICSLRPQSQRRDEVCTLHPLDVIKTRLMAQTSLGCHWWKLMCQKSWCKLGEDWWMVGEHGTKNYPIRVRMEVGRRRLN